MSMFSGKCDLYDSEVMISGSEREDCWKNIDLYIGSPLSDETPIQINITSQKDLVPYYPFLISASTYCDGKSKIWIHKKSYITENNEEMLELYKKHLLIIYNRCKRKEEQYNPEKAAKEVSCFEPEIDIIALAARVGKFGKKASIDGLVYSKLVNYYRQTWINELVKSGVQLEVAKFWVMNH